MAIDTRSKRASVLGIAAAITLTLPLSDGTVGQPDRQHVAYSYAGLTATTAEAATADYVVLCLDDSMVVMMQAEALVSVPGQPTVSLASDMVIVRVSEDDIEVVL